MSSGRATALTASRLRLRDRGILREGAAADLVVFDPATVLDAATYDDPHRYPVGIEHVIVNGGLALEGGETTRVQKSGDTPEERIEHAETYTLPRQVTRQ